MKIVVIGGSGLIGKHVVRRLRDGGHEAIAASPSTGVNAVTGQGLQEAVSGAQVVVDVANSPTFEERAAMEFFQSSARNLAAAEKAAGVQHHVALSVVGTERLQAMGYFVAKLAQEEIIAGSGVPYTIVRATQFFEFVGAIAQTGAAGETIRLPPAMMQPIAAEDVGGAVADVALGAPLNQIIEIAGPDAIRMDELAREYLAAHGDPRQVVTDPAATYFGIPVNDQSLTPGRHPRLGATSFSAWLGGAALQR